MFVRFEDHATIEAGSNRDNLVMFQRHIGIPVQLKGCPKSDHICVIISADSTEKKPKGDWTANEAADYAANCLVGRSD